MDSVTEGFEILPEQLQKVSEKKNWYEDEEWKQKGPGKRHEMNVGGSDVTVVNFNDHIDFQNYLDRTQTTLEDFQKRFPQAKGKLRWILIRDTQPPPLHDEFPANGKTVADAREGTMILEPRAFEDVPHRVSKAANLEGTLVHEMGHQIQKEFDVEWREHFPWLYAVDDPDNWIFDKSGEKDISKLKFPINKNSGRVAYRGLYPRFPEQCVTDYARLSSNEDVCESIVSYMFDPEYLKSVSPQKYDMVGRHTTDLEVPQE